MSHRINICSLLQLFCLGRLLQEMAAFSPFQALIQTLLHSAREMRNFAIALGITCLGVSFTYGGFFALFSYEDKIAARLGLPDFNRLVLSMFDVFATLVSGFELKAELQVHNILGACLFYLFANLFFFFVLSQVFIAILVGHFTTLESIHEEQLANNLLPEGFTAVARPQMWSRARFTTSAYSALCDLVYYFSWYDLKHREWSPTLLHRLCVAIAAAEASATDPVLLSERELAAAGISVESSIELRRVWGAHKGEAERTCARTAHRSSLSLRAAEPDEEQQAPCKAAPALEPSAHVSATDLSLVQEKLGAVGSRLDALEGSMRVLLEQQRELLAKFGEGGRDDHGESTVRSKTHHHAGRRRSRVRGHGSDDEPVPPAETSRSKSRQRSRERRGRPKGCKEVAPQVTEPGEAGEDVQMSLVT